MYLAILYSGIIIFIGLVVYSVILTVNYDQRNESQ